MLATSAGGNAKSIVARSNLVPRRFVTGALLFATVASLACKDATEPADDCSNIQNISIGVPVNGSLSVGDCRLSQDQSYVDYWRLVLTSSTTLQIDLESTAFNSYLLLLTEDGDDLGQADDGGSGENARLTVTRPAGTYHVLANSSDPGETGAYQLTISVVPPG